MASLERTAYPRFRKFLTPHDLERVFSPSAEDTEWVQRSAHQTDRQLALVVHLQCFAYMHYFTTIEQIPPEVVQYVAACMGIAPQDEIRYPDAHRSLYRHHETIRKLLGIKAYSGPVARAETIKIALEASTVVNTRVDIINIVISELVRKGYELPPFGTLVKIAGKQHEAAEQALYTSIDKLLSAKQRSWLEQLSTPVKISPLWPE